MTEEQIQMYKDCFNLMDIDHDGAVSLNDLRGAFDNVGVMMTEDELTKLIKDVDGDITCDAMIEMFEKQMSSQGNDPEDLIIQSFKAYDTDGKIDVKSFTHALTSWGDKMELKDVEDIFDEQDIDDEFMLKTDDILSLFVTLKEEVKKEATPPPPTPPPAENEDEEDADAKKKKKKKKKAAKAK